MKGIILYQSKYGATARYARWLSEATGFSITETKKAKLGDVKQYDTVVLGGGLYASGISGISFLRKNAEELKDKKIIVFCVGASPYSEEGLAEVKARNMKGALSGVPCFYCRGAWDFEKMGTIDKTLCKMLRKSVEKKPPEEHEPWEKALMEVGATSCDWTDRKHLEPILNELN